MKAPLSIQAKLITATVSLVLVCGFSTLHDITARSSGEIAFRIAFLAFGTFLAFFGVFGNAYLQLLWGWGLAITTPLLLSLCVFVFRGPYLFWGLLATLAAAVGGYFLLADAGVKNYRENIRKRTAADTAPGSN